MSKKYELTKETQNFYGRTLYRIKAIRDFSYVKVGDLGGWIESELNLSHEGDCWVSGNAMVYDDAKVYGNAMVYDDAIVLGNAKVYGNAMVYDDAKVYGNAMVYDDAIVYGKAEVYGNSWVSGNAKVYEANKALLNAPVGEKGEE